MTREIKFRAKGIDSNRWYYGGYAEDCSHNHVILPQDNWSKGGVVDKETIGQYTGLKDKNDVEIYEGDILSISKYFNNGLITFGRNENLDSFSLEELKGSLISKKREVVTCEEAAMIVGDMYLGALFGDMRKSMPIFEFEVIGNIYDNKDLLED